LVLPWDDLNLNPEDPAQSFRTWVKGRWRNGFGAERRTMVYVVEVPEVGRDVGMMEEWVRARNPCVAGQGGREDGEVDVHGVVEPVTWGSMSRFCLSG
jgi:archaemetzincin